MASSTTGGERKWGSQRRGGMRVLGKVAFPKPINLPSQRLENHGVDPNVEIVPKGNLSWGSRQSPSSNQNAWGSLPALSSSPTDGSVRHGLSNGRPSSGGSETRPSTAGSEKSHDPASGTWGGASRPSSASGLLASSLPSVSLRPHSAEARPGSSQLSRFAESVGENSVAWSGSGHADRASASSSFTLSSGDFPTLGFEKNSETNLQRDHSSHGRPSSSSGRVEPHDKTTFASADVGYSDAAGEKGVSTWKRLEPPHDAAGEKGVSTWKRQEPPHDAARPQSNIDKWREDSQEAMGYTNRNGPPQGFEQWHGPPVPNAPFHGSWYIGGPPPGPYGPAGPPGNYLVERPPFALCHPQSQVPVRPMPNQQISTRPGLAVGGPNGDPYRPHLAETYPVISHPVRPVRYPGPMPPYDNYARPQMHICEQNEIDPSLVSGMAGKSRPYFYPNYPRVRPSGYGPAAKGLAEASRIPDPGHRGPYNVLLKQHDGMAASGAEERKLAGSILQLEKGNIRQDLTVRDNVWEADSIYKNKAMDNPNLVRDEALSQPNKTYMTRQGHNSDKSISKNKQETAESLQVGTHAHSEEKNKSLIDKIEGLNSKSRITDGSNASGPILPSREATFKQSNNVGDDSSGAALAANPQQVISTMAPSPKDAIDNTITGDMSGDINFGVMPRVVNGMHGTTVSKGRARFSSRERENEEWKKKSFANSESSRSVSKNFDFASREIAENLESIPHKTESEFDSADYQAQRTRLKEVATQRAKQLQMEEEERMREQKAKALAKLEELNRRTLGENVSQKPDSFIILSKQEDAQIAEITNAKMDIVDGQCYESSSTSNLSCQDSEIAAHKNGELLDISAAKICEISCLPAPVVAANISFGSTYQAVIESSGERSLELHESNSFGQKFVGKSRRKFTSFGDSNQDEILITTECIDKVPIQADESAPSELIPVDNTSCNIDDSSSQHRKKHSRNSKSSKHKVDEASRETCLLTSAPVEGKSAKSLDESADRRDAVSVGYEPKAVLVADPSEVQNLQENNQAVEKAVNKQIEDARSRKTGTQGRLSSSRKALRNSQAVRLAEKSHGNENLMWAPVQSLSKQQQSFEQISQVEDNKPIKSPGKVVSRTGNSMKAKRAEMERYIPKPVAKDLSLQTNTQQSLSLPSSSTSSLPSSSTSIPNEIGNPIKVVSAGEGAGSLPNIRNIESRHSKHGKKHASWRQRSADELREGIVNSTEEPAISFEPDAALEKTKDHQSSKLESESIKLWEHDDHSSEETQTVVSNVHSYGLPIANGRTGSGRGRRQLNKMSKNDGYYRNSNEGMKKDAVDSGMPSKSVHNFAVETHVRNRKISTSPENSHGTGEAKPHWQPKHPKRQGTESSGFQKNTDDGVTPSWKDGSLHIQAAESLIIGTHELTVTGNISSALSETKHERVGKNLREEIHELPSQGVAENTDHRVEKQQYLWGKQQNQQQSGRFQRGHGGSAYGGNGGWGGETHKQQPYFVGDRRKPLNSYFEYQPVESHHKKPDKSFSGPSFKEEPKHEVSSSSGPRYKERGQSTLKRSSYYQEKNTSGAVSGREAA